MNKRRNGSMVSFFGAVLIAAPPAVLPARTPPPYTVAGNRALDSAASSASFAYMPVSRALEKNENDTLLCFYTATFHDSLLTLFNLLHDNLPQKPRASEKKRVANIQKTSWRVKRGAIALSYYCGIQPVYPKEWRVTEIKPGDRKAFARAAQATDRALDELKELIYRP